MLFLHYYPGRKYSVYFFCDNKSFRSRLSKRVPVNLSDAFVEASKPKNGLKLDFFIEHGLNITCSKLKYYHTIIDNYESSRIFLSFKKSNSINIINTFLKNFSYEDAIEDKYKKYRVLLKIFEVGSFLLIENILGRIEKDEYVAIALDVSISERSNYNFIDAAIFDIKQIPKKDTKLALLLFYILGKILQDYNRDMVHLLNLLKAEAVILTNPKLTKESYSKKFVKIFNEGVMKLRASKNKKAVIELSERYYDELGEPEIVLYPIYYTKEDKSTINSSLYNHILSFIKNRLEPNSIINFISHFINDFENKPQDYFVELNYLDLCFYVLLFSALFHSDMLVKIDEFYVGSSNFICLLPEVVFIHEPTGINIGLTNFNAIILSNNFPENDYINHGLIKFSIYKAHLTFISDDSYFIFPIINFYRKKSIHDITSKIEKTYVFSLLGKDMKVNLSIQENFANFDMVRVVRKKNLGIRIEYEMK